MKLISNIFAYIQGNIRYRLYNSKYRFLIRKHICEQINVRIASMDKRCYDQGSCILCGCTTTHLQMANKACDRPCYPKMLNIVQWHRIYNKKHMVITATGIWYIRDGKFKLV